MTIAQLRARIEAVCPVANLVAYSLIDKTKWVVTFGSGATAAQKLLAVTVMTTAPSLSPPSPPVAIEG